MPRTHVVIGPRPPEEKPVGSSDAKRYVNVLRRKLGGEVGTAKLRVLRRWFGFGTPVVLCDFDANDPVGDAYAHACRDHGPRTWRDVDRAEIADQLQAGAVGARVVNEPIEKDDKVANPHAAFVTGGTRRVQAAYEATIYAMRRSLRSSRTSRFSPLGNSRPAPGS
jgi:hypothetical protein